MNWSRRTRRAKPAAPYNKDPAAAAREAFDRESGTPVPSEWLESYARLLRSYARHPETKFLGGEHGSSGALKRRHVVPELIQYIGKEADRWEEDELFGADE